MNPFPNRFAIAVLSAIAAPLAAQPMDHSHMDMPMPGMEMPAKPSPLPSAPTPESTEPKSPAPDSMPTMSGMDHSAHKMPDMPGMMGGMSGLHIMAGDWMVMLHGYVWAAYTDQGGPRGDKMPYVLSHVMAHASRDIGNGATLQFNFAGSLEPLMGQRGYPNLFQTGETAFGVPLIDRQHPHDLFAELSARVTVPALGGKLILYGGPIGEPALGPTTYDHRPTSRFNPEAPISHHWFDSTHVTYGVVTAGYARGTWLIEGSAFRGREPDERRYNIETPKLDSYSVRLNWNPNAHWAAQISYGHLKSPEVLEPDADQDRYIVSASYTSGHGVNVAGGVSVKQQLPGRASTALFLEGNYDFAPHELIFGRIESVDNNELFNATPLDPRFDTPYRVSKFTLGYGYTVPISGPLSATFGGTASVYAKPAALDSAYGKFPVSGTLFVKFSLGS
jgi:hypothetical protein